MEINRDCPRTPTFDDLKPPIFTPRERSSESSVDLPPISYALNLTHLTDIQTPRNSLSFNEQLRRERDIAHQSSVITQDSFTTTYSNVQRMISQMQLKVASAFLQETEYLQHREERVEYDEKLLNDRQKQLENLRQQRKSIEQDFSQIKDRLEVAITEVTKFKTDGAEMLQTLFSESRQIDEKLSELISESMESLSRTRTIINTKTNEFNQKTDDIREELNDRSTLIRNTESTITMMLELINTLNQLNIEHSQDLSIVKIDFERRNHDLIDLSQTMKHNWDIKKEIQQIELLENEKKHVQNELYDQTLLLENLKAVLGRAIAH